MDKLFINLKVLGKIQEGQKLSSHEEELSIDIGTKNILQSFYRWIYNESRSETLTKIQTIIRDSINCGDNAIKSDMLDKSSGSSKLEVDELREQLDIKNWEKLRDQELQMNNDEVLSRLTTEMSEAIVGIKNLQKTYEDDVTLVSRFEVEIELIERGIKKFEDYITSTIK